MKKPYVTLINGKPPTLESLTQVIGVQDETIRRQQSEIDSLQRQIFQVMGTLKTMTHAVQQTTTNVGALMARMGMTTLTKGEKRASDERMATVWVRLTAE